MAEMTGGEALVASLINEGVSMIFGLPGVQLDGAFDALWGARDRIAVLHTRHEQATAYMADGYARTTGRVGTALVVPGPGLLNASAALCTAYACNSPVLMVAGQVQSQYIDAGRGLLHEIPDQLGMIRHVTKWAGRALSPAEIPGLVHEAFRQMLTGRPRPVEIEIPPDVLLARGDVTLREPYQPERQQPDSDLIDRAARLLGGAERPLIFAGGGVLAAAAWEELRRVAAMLQAPVIATQNGRGAISDRSYLSQPQLAAQVLTPQADAILAVGTRFLTPATASWGPKPEQPVVRLDVDPEEIERVHRPAVGIVADAKTGLAALAERLPRYNRARPSREEELRALQNRARDLLNTVQPQAAYAGVIREEMPDDGIVVGEMTQVGYWANQGFPVYEPRTYHTPGYQGTLGWGFGFALGAQAGNPAKKVLSINGDGGFGYQLAELSTMVRHNLPVVTVVFNDNAYGNVRRIQRQQYNGHVIASDLLNPDFVKLAESFGIEGRRAASPKEFRLALRSALANGHPTLIEVQMPPTEELPSSWNLSLK
jgi:acetolactate synthase-1/2/3 large subunit